MMGNALFMTAFIFVGPLPFVHVRPSKELIRVRKITTQYLIIITIIFENIQVVKNATLNYS